MSKQMISIALKVPDSAWNVRITEVHQIGNELVVVSQLTRRASMGAMVIKTARDSVEVAAPALPVKHILLGKTWQWENQEPYEFAAARADVDAKVQGGQVLLKR